MGLRVRPITLGLRRIVMRGTGAGRRIIIRPAVSSEGGGVAVHNDLSGRSAADSHPMSAITDLEPALTDIANAVQAQQGDIGTLQTAVAGKQAADADLTAIAALAPSDDALIQRKAGAWTSRTPAQVKADMSIGVGDVSGLDENTRDVIGAALVAGSGVAVTVDDPGNTITIAVSGVVADAINDGVTDVAPSQNAVFDALSIKVPRTRTIAGIDLLDDVTVAELRAALGIREVLLADWTLPSNASLWNGPTALDLYDEVRLEVTGRTTQGSSTGAVNLRFNGNSTSGDYINGGGGSSTWLTIGSIAGSLTNTNRWGRVEAIIQNKVGTLHTVSSQHATTDANTTPPNSSHTLVAAGHFKQTAAITTLAVYPNSSTDFVAGTRFRVFGRLI